MMTEALTRTAPASHTATSYFSVLFFIALALTAALLNSSAPTPLYPLYQQQLALTSVSLTMIYGAYAAGVLISLFAVGNLAGKVTDLRLMILPALGAVLGGAWLFAVADSFSLMFMARLLAGIGTGALTGAANLALIRFCPPDGGKRAALIATLSFTVGLALGPVFSSLSLQANFHPTVVPFVLIIVMAMTAALGVAFFWPKHVAVVIPHLTRGPRPQDSRLLIGLRLTGSKFFLCAAALFVSWAVAASILAIGPAIAEQLLSVQSKGLFGYVIALYLVIAGICQLVSRNLDSRFSLYSGCLAQGVAVMAFAAAVHFHSLFLAGMGMVVTGYAFGSIFVGSAALVNLISPKASHARLLSLFYVIAYTANWVPVLLGVIIDRSSLLVATNTLFIVAAPVCLFLSVFIARADFPRN
ncbi:MFS transporter [Yersinia kristensenii]|uniref:MFS transporter n=1 Tax=Yersinia kristensenii TaxID=28152 RepID=UPI000C14B743|nr:MFS transporter [Yersinia kristensenii]MDA5471891.1 MFS transporter [Yersinia kristensenii]MDA5475283.1 MFS transporter [Yersinia kristensenii]MDA5507355.1 MFS transporter [Yersinia kristensenii]MDA5521164.1 MFS transporter [Yersinia kristensenii]MDR4897966.1 MFS transporter [Yersinia kristensenii]